MKIGMKNVFIIVFLFIGLTGSIAQSYTLDIAKGDTALFYKINDSRPFMVQVEASGEFTGSLSIYSKSTSGVNWHIMDKGLFPISMNGGESFVFLNRFPVTRDWLFVWERSGQDSGYVFINIEDLRTSVGGSYFSEEGVIKGINKDRLKVQQIFDLTAQTEVQGNTLLPSNTEPAILELDSLSGTDTLFYYDIPYYNITGTTLTVGFDMDSISGSECSFGVGGSMFDSDFTLANEFISYDDVVADSTTNTKVDFLQVENFNYGRPVVWVSKGSCSGYIRWFIYINKK